ncbi:hypothetical protein JB92DRAFT_2919020 [Gautieria morchelliformis]|nr:hypothetical protein JB92DRAFT_2919020 [Gautieria morchelliformis]
MNFTPATTLISTVVSLFRKRTPQPTFTPVIPPMATQVYITRDMTARVDPPAVIHSTDQPSASDKRRKDRPFSLHLVADISEKQKRHLYPKTPCTPSPRRTTFFLRVHDWNTAEFFGGQPFGDDNETSLFEIDLDVPPRACHPTELGVYAVAKPKTLAKALFFLGFVFPAFWVAGSAIMLMPLRTTTDWEAGRSSQEIKWGCSVIRETELRWAKRCVIALLSEVFVILLVVVIVKWGVMAPV